MRVTEVECDIEELNVISLLTLSSNFGDARIIEVKRYVNIYQNQLSNR